MNRIDKRFRQLREAGKKAFIAYITAGDPSLSATAKLVRGLEDAGVDIVELGIPFSDPLADGPTIQAASQRALRRGTTVRKIFGLVRSVRRATDIPLVFMTYYNPVLRYGLSDFIDDCASAGVDGVIVPDLPEEEAKDLMAAGRAKNVAVIFLVAPTSTARRMRSIAKKSKGFIYYVSLTGVTGARKDLPAGALANVRRMQSLTDKPVCVGFGVSTPAQARLIARVADGVIVGSAIIKVVEKNLGNKNLVPNVASYAKRLARAIHHE